MSLGADELFNLEESLMRILPDKISEILSRLNSQEKIEELLDLLGMQNLLGPNNSFSSYKNGKIVVLGGSDVSQADLLGIAKNLGFNKDRFEFYLDYKKLKKFNYKKLRYAPEYRLVLVGQIPHSAAGKENSSSLLTNLENKDGYPKVDRLIANRQLKVTKTKFREVLEQELANCYITV